ncbi:hypothetical protein [Asticcacaulis sp. YBE204]|uniref:hypothetical protein n=1 Tax=Asticcacaulis sp. YBE204 TaxID=1282363 RepID=UPI0003C3D845|nr:hypothetical protein [Asticcacaulis sp. YBE204]ESQ77481.1 hypothetical protein AEYBE204_17225 [Asticcacaulis sp. YBE204]
MMMRRAVFFSLILVSSPVCAEEPWPEPVISKDPAKIRQCQALSLALDSHDEALTRLYRDTGEAGNRAGMPSSDINRALREVDQLRMDATVMSFDLQLWYDRPAGTAQGQAELNALPIPVLLAYAETCFTWPDGRKPPRTMAKGAPFLNE